MHITVAGKQVETGEALKTHVREGLSLIARKYFDHALEANVTFRRDAMPLLPVSRRETLPPVGP